MFHDNREVTFDVEAVESKDNQTTRRKSFGFLSEIFLLIEPQQNSSNIHRFDPQSMTTYFERALEKTNQVFWSQK